MRGISVLFQVYLSNKIGSAGIGLFGLIASVQMLAVTFAMSGIRLTTTRLVSEEIGLCRPGGVRRAVILCITYALFFGTAASLLLYNGAEYIGNVWIGDERTILSLKILSLSLPFMSMSSVLGGYFTAVQRVLKSAAVQMTEHFIRILVVMGILVFYPPENLEYACVTVVIGGVAAEFVSFFLLFFIYRIDLKRVPHVPYAKEKGKLTSRMFGIALPLAFSTYARSALSTLEHMLVPRGLRASGASSDTALESYGAIHGMVFPILILPSALFTSLGEMVVPVLTEAQMEGRKERISYLVNKILKLCAIFSIGIAGIFFFYNKELSGIIYKNDDVSSYFKIFSLLIPVLYIDSVTDGMLKGLGQQLHSMFYNITDSIISVILVYVLLPRYAINAYICIIFFTECYNFALSIRHISKITTLLLKPKDLLIPVICIIGAGNFSILILRILGFSLAMEVLSIILHILLTAILYFLLLYLLSGITKEDLKWMKEIIK